MQTFVTYGLKQFLSTGLVAMGAAYAQQKREGATEEEALHFAAGAGVTLAVTSTILAAIQAYRASFKPTIMPAIMQKGGVDVLQTVGAMLFICGVFQSMNAIFGAYDETGAAGARKDFGHFMEVLIPALFLRMIVQWSVNAMKPSVVTAPEAISTEDDHSLTFSRSGVLGESLLENGSEIDFVIEVYSDAGGVASADPEPWAVFKVKAIRALLDVLPAAAEIGVVLGMGFPVGIVGATDAFACAVAAVAAKNCLWDLFVASGSLPVCHRSVTVPGGQSRYVTPVGSHTGLSDDPTPRGSAASTPSGSGSSPTSDPTSPRV